MDERVIETTMKRMIKSECDLGCGEFVDAISLSHLVDELRYDGLKVGDRDALARGLAEAGFDVVSGRTRRGNKKATFITLLTDREREGVTRLY